MALTEIIIYRNFPGKIFRHLLQLSASEEVYEPSWTRVGQRFLQLEAMNSVPLSYCDSYLSRLDGHCAAFPKSSLYLDREGIDSLFLALVLSNFVFCFEIYV